MLWHWIADAGGQAAVAKNRIYFRLPDGDVHVGSHNMGPSHIKAFWYFWFEITTDINGWFEITTDHFLEAH